MRTSTAAMMAACLVSCKDKTAGFRATATEHEKTGGVVVQVQAAPGAHPSS
jgi:hypothetical protein